MAETIAIIGPGTMGTGIAQTVLTAGYNVVLIGRSADSAEFGAGKIAAGFDRAVSKGKFSAAQKDDCIKRLKPSGDIADVKYASVIIEAVPEEEDMKISVLLLAEKNANPDAVIATNTSSISINALAGRLSSPERFMGLHFFNPVPVMKLVEAVRGSMTSAATIASSRKFVERLGKSMIEVNDSPGFVSNRILMPFINEAALALQEGVATKESIDSIAKLGFNHPMGPLELADLIGLDVCKDIMDAVYAQTKSQKFVAAKLLADLVAAGNLGRKTGKGFYEYSQG